ncbi:MAG: metal ABC transporter permease [Nitrospirae bacterium]|nr:metal ABC transporter permease [Nitrospirota bacterium]
MLEMLSYEFMQRAILASIIIGLVCSIIGVFVILKNLTFIGAGTSHAAFAGVTLGYLTGYNPLSVAIIFSLITVWIVGYLNKKGALMLDTSVGIFYSLTMALAVLFIGLMKVYNAEVYGYLFGSILSVTKMDLKVILILGTIVLSIVYLFFKEFHFITFDEEMAKASGIPTGWLSFLLLNMIALTIVVSLKSVGAILVFALIVTPAAAAYQLTYSMVRMFIYSGIIGVVSSVAGVLLSYWFDLPSGATTVLFVSGVFVLSVVFSPKRRIKELENG